MDRIYHSILEFPHRYDIDYFAYRSGAHDASESWIDLHLRRGDEVVELRFWGPRDLEIESGFPDATRGMFFEDVSSHSLESLNVYVGDCEASHGSVTFWARSVERLN